MIAALVGALVGAWMLGVFGPPLMAWAAFLVACKALRIRWGSKELSLGLFGYVVVLTQLPAWTALHMVVLAGVVSEVLFRRAWYKAAFNVLAHALGFMLMAVTWFWLEQVMHAVWPSLASALALMAGALVFEVTTSLLYWLPTGMTLRWWTRTEWVLFTESLAAAAAAVTATLWPPMMWAIGLGSILLASWTGALGERP